MRAPLPVVAVVGVTVLTGCTTQPEQSAEAAAPSAAASADAPASTVPSAGAAGAIRQTDWPDVNLSGLAFMDLGDLRFRDGKASAEANNCTMLPGGARPAYAEFLTEEPAGSPVTEDALVLVECGSDGMDQALVPVKLGADGTTREAVGFIEADPPAGPGKRMTFTSYVVERGTVVTAVRTADGRTETRRYRFDGGTRWERVP